MKLAVLVFLAMLSFAPTIQGQTSPNEMRIQSVILRGADDARTRRLALGAIDMTLGAASVVSGVAILADNPQTIGPLGVNMIGLGTVLGLMGFLSVVLPSRLEVLANEAKEHRLDSLASAERLRALARAEHTRLIVSVTVGAILAVATTALLVGSLTLSDPQAREAMATTSGAIFAFDMTVLFNTVANLPATDAVRLLP